MAVLGIIILIYAENFVEDLRDALSDTVQFTWTGTLLRILLWVLVAWLFVDAALIVILSVTDQRVSPTDLMRKMEELEKKLDARVRTTKKLDEKTEASVPVASSDELPPPPRE